MTLLNLLETLEAAGIVLSANGDKLKWDAPVGIVTPDLLEAMRAAKPILLKLVAGDWYGAALMMLERIDDPDRRDDLRYQFDERMAICMIDAGLSEDQAQGIATNEILSEIRRLDEQSSHKQTSHVDYGGRYGIQTTRNITQGTKPATGDVWPPAGDSAGFAAVGGASS